MDPAKAAEVRPACTVAERIGRVRSMHQQHVRVTLEQQRDIGKELVSLKEQCVRENRPWLPCLAEMRMNRHTAARYMRVARNWTLFVDYVALAQQGGVAESINAVAGDGPEEQEIYGHKAPEPAKSPAAGAAPAPAVPGVLCPTCQRRGYRIGCGECQALNRAGSPKPPKADPGTPREPGSDDGEVDASYQRYEEERLKAVSGPLIREIRKIGQCYGLKVPESKRPWQPSLPFEQWFDHFDPRFRPVLRDVWAARKRLRELLQKLEEERAKGAEGGLPE